MPQELKHKKADVLTHGVTLAKEILAVVHNAAEWVDNLTSNAFQQGGTSAIVDADIPTTEATTHLTPTLVQQLRVACNTISGALTAGQKDNLRQIARGLVKAQ